MTDDELRKLLAAATPGPWRTDVSDFGYSNTGGAYVGVDDCVGTLAHVLCAEHAGRYRENPYKANARLIAAAPDLAAEVLRLRDALRDIAAPAAYGCSAQDRIEAMRDEARAALENKQ